MIQALAKHSAQRRHRKVEDKAERWNPDDFGELEPGIEKNGQLILTFYDPNEPPDPDDFNSIAEFGEAWRHWELKGKS